MSSLFPNTASREATTRSSQVVVEPVPVPLLVTRQLMVDRGGSPMVTGGAAMLETIRSGYGARSTRRGEIARLLASAFGSTIFPEASDCTSKNQLPETSTGILTSRLAPRA